MEEYGPEIKYIKGNNNIAADAPRRLPIEENLPTNSNMEECYANDTMDVEAEFPLHHIVISKQQAKDSSLQNDLKSNPGKYETRRLNNVEVLF